MSNMQREVKQADALDKLRLCVTCGQACVRRPGTNWRMQGCANHTRAHCCGAVHDGDCRADLKSLSGKQLFEPGWLCPLCAPLPTDQARLALRLHDVKRQYRVLAARHVKLGMTAKGFAAACADMHGDELTPRRARGSSSDTSCASDASSFGDSDKEEAQDNDTASGSCHTDSVPATVFMGWTEAQLRAACAILPEHEAALSLQPGLAQMQLADAARFVTRVLGVTGPGAVPTARVAARTAELAAHFRRNVTDTMPQECSLLPCKACREAGGFSGGRCFDAMSLHGMLASRCNAAQRPTPEQAANWATAGLTLAHPGEPLGVGHDSRVFVRRCRARSHPDGVADTHAAREAAFERLQQAVRAAVDASAHS